MTRHLAQISGFMAQFGIHGNPKVSAEWRDKKIKDDPVKHSNEPYCPLSSTNLISGAPCLARLSLMRFHGSTVLPGTP